VNLKKTVLRELRGQREIHIDSITVRIKKRRKGRRWVEILEVAISPAPPKGSVDTDIEDDELVVKFHRKGTLGRTLVTYPGLVLRRGLNLSALRKKKIKWT